MTERTSLTVHHTLPLRTPGNGPHLCAAVLWILKFLSICERILGRRAPRHLYSRSNLAKTPSPGALERRTGQCRW
jgi:hypothetical protein